jgi:hypothetical protein
MNFLHQTYNELLERILEKHTPGTNKQHLTTDIKHVDIYYGQDLDEKGQVKVIEPANLPAVYIEFSDITTETIGRKVQQGDALITFYLISSTKLKTSSPTPEVQRNMALDHLERLNQLHYRLQGFGGTCFSSLDRVSISSHQYYGQVIRHAMAYRCRIEDDSAKHLTNAAGTLALNNTIVINP